MREDGRDVVDGCLRYLTTGGSSAVTTTEEVTKGDEGASESEQNSYGLFLITSNHPRTGGEHQSTILPTADHVSSSQTHHVSLRCFTEVERRSKPRGSGQIFLDPERSRNNLAPHELMQGRVNPWMDSRVR